MAQTESAAPPESVDDDSESLGSRWAYDPYAGPNDPFAYLDGNRETSPVAIGMTTLPGGMRYYKLVDIEDRCVGMSQNLRSLSVAAEAMFQPTADEIDPLPQRPARPRVH
jgi:hypothetical protein